MSRRLQRCLGQLRAQPTSGGGSQNVQTQMMQDWMDQPCPEIRRAVRRMVDADEYLEEKHFMPYMKQRKYTYDQFIHVLRKQHVDIYDIRDRPERVFAFFDGLSSFDQSIVLRFVMQYNLWAGTLLLLGTERHHKKYLEPSRDGTITGMFGLTELGHGSNVQGLETTAHYQPKTDSFVLHSPTWTSQKYWPGGICGVATHGVIFAQTYVHGVYRGLHAFVIRMRDRAFEKLRPGLIARDIGYKLCFQGIDNGNLRLNQVQVPRTDMLDRFCQVLPPSAENQYRGEYRSCLDNPTARFGQTLGAFIGGRLCAGMTGASKACLAIAIRYSEQRRQFGPSRGREVCIMDYPTQQMRLLPGLARVVGLTASHGYLSQEFSSFMREYHACAPGQTVRPAPPVSATKWVHALSAAVKAVGTWDQLSIAQQCRECLGGQGFVAKSRVAMLRDHIDLYVTGEGDNTVLLQTVNRFVLDYHKSRLQSAAKSTQSAATAPIIPYSAQRLLDPVFRQQLLSNLESALAFDNMTAMRLGAGGGRGESKQSSFWQWHGKQWEMQPMAWVAVDGLLHRLHHIRLGHFSSGQMGLTGGSKRSKPNALTRQVMRLLLDLHGVWRIWHYRDLFLHYLSDAKQTGAAGKLRDLVAKASCESVRAGGSFAYHVDRREGGSVSGEGNGLVTVPAQTFLTDVRRLLTQLTSQLRPFALAVVESFGLPDKCVAYKHSIEAEYESRT